MPDNLLDNLDVFYGELTPARATVYARLEGLESTSELSLSGFVRGPRCFYSKTLPATFRLQDAGPGPSLLAKSLVPDPSYWSPETPHIYDITVELRKGAEIIASDVRQIGFKPLGISGRFFTWEGKPWVLRGIHSRSVKDTDVVAWRAESAALVESSCEDQSLAKASESGVICCCFINDNSSAWSQLRRLAKYPAVAFAVLFREYSCTVTKEAPNILCSQIHVGGRDYGRHTEPGVSFVYLDKPSEMNSACGLNPLLVCRKIPTPVALTEARAACDKLQADFAPIGQFAGYIV